MSLNLSWQKVDNVVNSRFSTLWQRLLSSILWDLLNKQHNGLDSLSELIECSTIVLFRWRQQRMITHLNITRKISEPGERMFSEPELKRWRFATQSTYMSFQFVGLEWSPLAQQKVNLKSFKSRGLVWRNIRRGIGTQRLMQYMHIDATVQYLVFMQFHWWNYGSGFSGGGERGRTYV